MLRHPNIICFIGACIEPGKLAIITEFCALGTVYTILQNNNDLSWDKKLKLAHDTALGLFYLHKMDIVHFDLKPSNLLVDESWNVKVADFGLAKLRENSNDQKGMGTPQYMSVLQLSLFKKIKQMIKTN